MTSVIILFFSMLITSCIYNHFEGLEKLYILYVYPCDIEDIILVVKVHVYVITGCMYVPVELNVNINS